MSRRFNRAQRIALYLGSTGHCSHCGITLAPGWHADHIEPWSRGGTTDVLNGQALCPACNQRKGATPNMAPTLAPWPESITHREWARRAFDVFENRTVPDFLCAVTPGGGKTRFALRVAHELLSRRDVARLVIVVPTQHLRTQWKDEAAKVGIQLDDTFSNGDGGLTSDFHGMAITYQTVAAAPQLHRFLCNRPTLVIFDELHHAGDSQTWGEAILQAYEGATARLSLTGTPFRSDSSAIPFVRYHEGRCVPDFVYGYADALRDGICRHVFFPSYEGNMSWFSGSMGEVTARFADNLPDDEQARRVRTALMSGDWLDTVLRDANDKLTEVRRFQLPNAGGLVIAIDQTHAQEIKKKLALITGEEPAIAVSDMPDASAVIKRFAKGNKRWIVAVKMVSEGVDIPRLCVGVYATNVLTEMFLRQAVGRFVRWIPGVEDQPAYFYIYADQRLVDMVMQIKQERDIVIRETGPGDEPPNGTLPAGTQSSLFLPGSAEAQADDVIIAFERFSQSEMGRAKLIREQLAMQHIAVEDFAKIARYLTADTPVLTTGPTQPTKPTMAVADQRKTLRERTAKLVNAFAISSSLTHQEANYLIKLAVGVPPSEATLDELQQRFELARRLLEISDGEENRHNADWWKDKVMRVHRSLAA